jgi:hypothetical protein
MSAVSIPTPSARAIRRTIACEPWCGHRLRQTASLRSSWPEAPPRGWGARRRRPPRAARLGLCARGRARGTCRSRGGQRPRWRLRTTVRVLGLSGNFLGCFLGAEKPDSEPSGVSLARAGNARLSIRKLITSWASVRARAPGDRRRTGPEWLQVRILHSSTKPVVIGLLAFFNFHTRGVV